MNGTSAKRTVPQLANLIALTGVFVLSFVSYMAADLTLSIQLAPLVLFLIIVVFRVFMSKDLLPALESLFEIDSLVCVLLLSLLVIAPSIQSELDRSFSFSLMLAACLVLARLYMAVVDVNEVIEAFFWAAVISIAILLPLTFGNLLDSIRTFSRFAPFSFHPNLLGFVLGGYFCAAAWKFITGARFLRLIAFLTGITCLLLTFFASSRGAILGIAGGCTVIVAMWIIRMPERQRPWSLKHVLPAIGLALIAFVAVEQSEWVQGSFDFVDKVLELNDAARGIDSGLTGRVDKWREIAVSLGDGSWLLGHGIRSSDSMAQLIDNSYIVYLYEVGILAVILISSRFLTVLWRFMRAYFTDTDRSRLHLWMACTMLLTSFLMNNFVARYLLAIGNPYSLLALLLFVSPSRQRSLPKLKGAFN
jgi:O-antigen ligase